jgi:hypothetical protein
MGASEFSTYAFGKNAGDAFSAAVSEAQYQHGHGGYSGTIAEKHNFHGVIELPARVTSTEYLDALSYLIWRPEGRLDASEVLRTRTMPRMPSGLSSREKKAWQATKKVLVKTGLSAREIAVYDDKWGPALALKPNAAEQRKLREGHGFSGKRGVFYLFAGLASD